MGVYENRDSPPRHPVLSEWAQNPRILRWWTSAHDASIAQAIHEWQWMWALKIAQAIIQLTPETVLADWRDEDPLCRKYSWYNILMGFAEARAEVLNLTTHIRRPDLRAGLEALGCRRLASSMHEDGKKMATPLSMLKWHVAE